MTARPVPRKLGSIPKTIPQICSPPIACAAASIFRRMYAELRAEIASADSDVHAPLLLQDFAELPSSICAVQSCLEDFAIFKLALSKKFYAIFLFLSGVASEYAA